MVTGTYSPAKFKLLIYPLLFCPIYGLGCLYIDSLKAPLRAQVGTVLALLMYLMHTKFLVKVEPNNCYLRPVVRFSKFQVGTESQFLISYNIIFTQIVVGSCVDINFPM